MPGFQKKGRAASALPKGVRTSVHNAQLLVSTGEASLDALLGTLDIVPKWFFLARIHVPWGLPAPLPSGVISFLAVVV